jgi:hypothetical protein
MVANKAEINAMGKKFTGDITSASLDQYKTENVLK